ncbi:hypothetical protein DAMNIGENAA_26230 [Desulforhabdus amnigena]|jgi:hypothetical protein|uniref:Uncharacterized protein n=1 Tax=Desulforhabdus amnigena TaxID=40218 RepID=A0A9W6L9E4_9BACT|nr:hypothetical protein DAMNIGENAA_26230 [Desulforhabdus amnigena]
MQLLFDILTELDRQERDDFTSWFASLSLKEREAVTSAFASTTVDQDTF